MAGVSKQYQDELPDLKKNVEEFHEYFLHNYQRYHDSRKFVFDTSLDDAEITLLKTIKKPQIEFNICEAFISRLRGEFSKQEPSFCVGAEDGMQAEPKTIDFVEGHLRHLMSEANAQGCAYNIYTDLLSGGFSVAKVWTEYVNEMSFNQVLKYGRVFDPTLCGFDPLARLPSKSDGNFCFEIFPMKTEDFKRENPKINVNGLSYTKLNKFSWSYKHNSSDFLLVCDYYKKKKTKVKICQLVTGQVIRADDYKKLLDNWDHLSQAPAILGTPRYTEITTICRYRFIEDQVVEYVETNFKYLPLVFFDGNSVILKKTTEGESEQMTRPYIHHVKGAQKLKNFAGQTWANEIENMVTHKWIVPEEGIPHQYTAAYTNNQVPSVLIYKSYADDDQNRPLAPPQAVPRIPMPPEIASAFSVCDQTIQNILGSYDASLGINNNQLSGVAIVEAATQSNAAAMPFVVGYLEGLNAVGRILLDLIPKYYVSPRTLPMMGKDGKRKSVKINQPGGIQLDYDEHALNIKVEAGVNFSIQKSRALQQIMGLMQASPTFAQFMNSKGLPILLDNMEIRGADQLKSLAEAWSMDQEKQMQMQQKMAMEQHQNAMNQNPVMMKFQQEQQRLQMDAAQNQAENQLKAMDLTNDANANETEKLKVQLLAQQKGVESAVQIKKAIAEENRAKSDNFSKAVEMAMKIDDQQHRHNKETLETAHNILSSADSSAPDNTDNGDNINGT